VLTGPLPFQPKTLVGDRCVRVCGCVCGGCVWGCGECWKIEAGAEAEAGDVTESDVWDERTGEEVREVRVSEFAAEKGWKSASFPISIPMSFG
jgi:hypothetical protein